MLEMVLNGIEFQAKIWLNCNYIFKWITGVKKNGIIHQGLGLAHRTFAQDICWKRKLFMRAKNLWQGPATE